MRWCEHGYEVFGQDGILLDCVVGGMPQGDPLIPVFFGALMAHKVMLTDAFLEGTVGAPGDQRSKALALFYADDGFMGSLEPAAALRYRKHFQGDLASKDDVYINSAQTRAECEADLRSAGFNPEEWHIVCRDFSSYWTDDQRAQARESGAAGLPLGTKCLGVPVGNAAFVEQFVRRAAQGDKREDEGSASSAQDHVGSLRVLGDCSQERLLLLRHCVAVKLAHLARFASAELFEQVTQNLQDDIEQEIRGLAQATSAEFSSEAMRLARKPLSMGGLGVMRMTRDAAAVAAMSSAASALARLSKSLAKKRKDLTWVNSLLQDTLAAPGGGESESEPEEEAEEEEDEDEAKAQDSSRAGKAEPGEPTAAQLAARQAAAEARAEAAEDELAAQEQADARAEGAGQTVLCTLLKGWAVAARRLAQIAALRGTARKQHLERTTSYVRDKGNPDPRKVPAVIPQTFAALAQVAAKDNNKLQSRINVHEHALDWIRIFEGSAQNKATQRRLEDLLLPGTNAVFAAIPSSAAMRVKADQLAFRIRMQFGMKAKLGGFYEMDAYELALRMGQREKNLRHDAVTDAILVVSVASNLVACREPEKHFHCHNGTGLSVCPDGAIILEDGTVVGIDVVFAATAAAAREQIREKKWGQGAPQDREATQAERAEVHARVGEAVRAGRMTAREAQDARYKIGLRKESSYHSGYVKPLALGGAEFLCVCLSYFGGWRSPLGEYTERVGHTGDEEPIYSHGARFEHPARTWASVTHKQFSMQATTVATVNATYDWVAAEAKRVMREVLGVRAKERRHTVTPPVAQARQADALDNSDDGVSDEQGGRAAA